MILDQRAPFSPEQISKPSLGFCVGGAVRALARRRTWATRATTLLSGGVSSAVPRSATEAGLKEETEKYDIARLLLSI